MAECTADERYVPYPIKGLGAVEEKKSRRGCMLRLATNGKAPLGASEA